MAISAVQRKRYFHRINDNKIWENNILLLFPVFFPAGVLQKMVTTLVFEAYSRLSEVGSEQIRKEGKRSSPVTESLERARVFTALLDHWKV